MQYILTKHVQYRILLVGFGSENYLRYFLLLEICPLCSRRTNCLKMEGGPRAHLSWYGLLLSRSL